MWAAREGRAKVVQLLLSAGANTEAAARVISINNYCMAVGFFFALIKIFIASKS